VQEPEGCWVRGCGVRLLSGGGLRVKKKAKDSGKERRKKLWGRCGVLEVGSGVCLVHGVKEGCGAGKGEACGGEEGGEGSVMLVGGEMGGRGGWVGGVWEFVSMGW